MMIADNSLADVKAMIDEISDLTPHEKDLAFTAWSLALSESSFSRAADCPFAPGSEPYSIVEHTHAVTQGALALADMVQKIHGIQVRSEEHTSELQSLMRISYAVFCLKKKTKSTQYYSHLTQ